MKRIVIATALSACVSALVAAAGPDARVADAARTRDAATARTLLRAGADVNAAHGDGMTALHWAAINDDADMASMLLFAGANVRATTRLGGFTALHFASKAGHVATIRTLVAQGAAVNAPTSTGATPLMLAAGSGNTDAIGVLLDAGADPNARENAQGQTALMFAAALDRAEAATLLLHRGADAGLTSKTADVSALIAPEERVEQDLRDKQNARSTGEQNNRARPAPAPKKEEVAGVTRPFTYNELIGRQGGLTALHFAARQGATQTVRALIDAGADVNQVSAADRVSPLLIATINGHFDIAAYLLDRGANPNLPSDDGVTPLYGVVNLEWAPRMFYPQPRAQLQQRTTYLELMTQLLDKGADPNARLNKKLWYTQFNFDLLRIDDTGATPFWRAAYASDIEAMRLLLVRGADPSIPTMKAARREQFQAGTRGTDESKDHSGLPPVPVGAGGIPPLLAAAGAGYGEGFAGNAHRFAPSGMLAGVKFLIEEVGVDVNAVDHEGYTALHHAAARGDNEMILYLISKGGDPRKVSRGGQTTVDMANGPVQRIQPFPETIKLLEGLGAKNNHKCVSC